MMTTRKLEGRRVLWERLTAGTQMEDTNGGIRTRRYGIRFVDLDLATVHVYRFRDSSEAALVLGSMRPAAACMCFGDATIHAPSPSSLRSLFFSRPPRPSLTLLAVCHYFHMGVRRRPSPACPWTRLPLPSHRWSPIVPILPTWEHGGEAEV
jgi:hypothetical protein